MSQPAQDSASAATNGSASAAAKHSATQIGFQFVNQYYTYLNSSTEKLHRFYTKRSTFCHATEGDIDPPEYYGQQDIHNKIMSLGFRDPKAFVHHISAQSSEAGGILIQVIGEMQNGDDAPWKKFTQTFFLAEQPNGYFVLNDIFMYLKEENEFDEDEPVQDEEHGDIVDAEESKPVEEVAAKEEAPIAEEKEVEAAPAPVEEKKEEVAPAQPEEVKQDEPAPTPAPAAEKEEPVEAAPAVVEEEKAETAPEPPVSEPAETPKAEQPVEKVEQKKEPEQPKPQQQQQPAKPAAAPAPPKPTGPPPPKTWASLAAQGSKGAWGNSLASKEAASTSAAAQQPAQTPAAAQPAKQQQARPAPKEQQQQSGASTPAAAGQQALGGHPAGKYPQLDAARAVTTNICFVKLNNWQSQETTPPVSEAVLGNTLGKYGEITKIDFVKTKACAFVEYKSVESARRAIIASLRTVDGGEGGIKIPAEGGGYQKIIVESRKEKEDRGKGALPVGAGSAQGQGAQAGQGPRRQGQQGQGQGQGGPRGGQGAGGPRGGGRGGRGGQQGQGQNRQQPQQQQ